MALPSKKAGAKQRICNGKHTHGHCSLPLLAQAGPVLCCRCAQPVCSIIAADDAAPEARQMDASDRHPKQAEKHTFCTWYGARQDQSRVEALMPGRKPRWLVHMRSSEMRKSPSADARVLMRRGKELLHLASVSYGSWTAMPGWKCYIYRDAKRHSRV